MPLPPRAGRRRRGGFSAPGGQAAPEIERLLEIGDQPAVRLTEAARSAASESVHPHEASPAPVPATATCSSSAPASRQRRCHRAGARRARRAAGRPARLPARQGLRRCADSRCAPRPRRLTLLGRKCWRRRLGRCADRAAQRERRVPGTLAVPASDTLLVCWRAVPSLAPGYSRRRYVGAAGSGGRVVVGVAAEGRAGRNTASAAAGWCSPACGQ